ncbi:MAG: hypothetical protein ACRCVT_15535, partial [Leadbetterella sp.]
MKMFKILASAVLLSTLPLLIASCEKPPRNLTKDELTTANNSARSFFSAQQVKGTQGAFLSCSGRDSDADGNTTCTGQIPVQSEDKINMVFQEIICA